MAVMKVITCREHGGTFRIPSRRGRPPVKCNPDNACDMASGKRKPPARKVEPTPVKSTTTRKRPAKVKATEEVEYGTPQEAAETTPKRRRKANPVVVRNNPSIPLAMHARGQLEPLGWELTGKAWFDEEDEKGWASVEGHRGTEHIGLWFRDGTLHSSDYTLWDAAKESTNGRPKSRLPFNPDEMTDAELAVELRNKKVVWWNRLGKSRETAYIGDKFQIKHAYDYAEDGEYLRIVEFVDKGGSGFRALHIHALLKVE